MFLQRNLLKLTVFLDRSEAGRKLAANLFKYQKQKILVLALPRGGVVVGYEVAKTLNAPFDVLISRKLGAPVNPELGIGAISENNTIILDNSIIDTLGISQSILNLIIENEKEELERRINLYRQGRNLPSLNDYIVILVDDGLATGVTAKAAVKAVLKKNPKKLIVAAPVCSQDAVEGLKSILRPKVDKIECLTIPYDFTAVGLYYQHFNQISDKEVVNMLNQAKHFYV